MEKLIPLSKMSKKARKAYNESKRGSWNGLNPITRTNAKSKGYNRAFEKQSAGELFAIANTARINPAGVLI